MAEFNYIHRLPVDNLMMDGSDAGAITGDPMRGEMVRASHRIDRLSKNPPPGG